MSGNKFTPGPWRRVGNSIQAGDYAEHTHCVVASCYDAATHDEDAANARLIAAAPDLLDEMERMRHSLAVLRLQPIQDPDVRKLFDEMYAGAVAAIAKARGK